MNTISTSGISPSQVIRAEHLLRIIRALDGTSNNDITISGSFNQGYYTTASGDYSHAEGNSTQAIGDYSHAEGEKTQAIGSHSHAEGAGTIAIGSHSHAEGVKTQAAGDFSHAEGIDTVSLGLASHAEGLRTIALGDHQHVQGQYNISSSAQSAFIIGNGADNNNRSNLIFASGSQFEISGSLHISGSPSYIYMNDNVGGLHRMSISTGGTLVIDTITQNKLK